MRFFAAVVLCFAAWWLLVLACGAYLDYLDHRRKAKSIKPSDGNAP